MKHLLAAALLLCVGCSQNPVGTLSAGMNAASALSGATDTPLILTNGTIDLTGQDIIRTGNGPAVTDNGLPVVCTLIVRDIKTVPAVLADCYDGAAVELSNPNSSLVLYYNTIDGHMRGIDSYGDIETHGGAVYGRRDCAIELRPYAHGLFYSTPNALGEEGYYGCNSGFGGVGILAVHDNGEVHLYGDATAKWDYSAKAGVNSQIIVHGNLYYYGPRTPTSGNVIVEGGLMDLNAVPEKPGLRKGWHKNR